MESELESEFKSLNIEEKYLNIDEEIFKKALNICIKQIKHNFFTFHIIASSKSISFKANYDNTHYIEYSSSQNNKIELCIDLNYNSCINIIYLLNSNNISDVNYCDNIINFDTSYGLIKLNIHQNYLEYIEPPEKEKNINSIHVNLETLLLVLNNVSSIEGENSRLRMFIDDNYKLCIKSNLTFFSIDVKFKKSNYNNNYSILLENINYINDFLKYLDIMKISSVKLYIYKSIPFQIEYSKNNENISFYCVHN